MLTPQDNKKILGLYNQVLAIYREAKKRPSNMVCVICGAGDRTIKTGTVLKVKHIVKGYELRPEHSPRLCYRHNSGWAQSFESFNGGRTRIDVEVDLHFARYIALQVKKEADVLKRKANGSNQRT